jgi:multidrug efflux pump subunit AcrA (membrane-fusion protein)
VTFQEPRPVEDAASRGARPSGSGLSLPAAGPPVVLIPKRAVTDQGGDAVVWVVASSKASRRKVSLGPERIDQVEVRSGLVPGEAVVLNPPSLTDGTRVRVRGK